MRAIEERDYAEKAGVMRNNTFVYIVRKDVSRGMGRDLK